MGLKLTGGEAGGRTIRSLAGQQTRPTSAKARAALFDIVRDHVEGRRWLDLFAGNGTVGFEALSRGADHVTFVERSREAGTIIRANAVALGYSDRCTLISDSVRRFLGQRAGEPVDVAFLDPPWAADVYDATLAALAKGVVRSDGVIIAEHRRSSPLPEVLDGWRRERTADYGDTSFSFYRSGSPVFAMARMVEQDGHVTESQRAP